MDAATAASILDAIQSHGSKAYITPSGPVLTLLSDLAGRGDLRSFSNAFVIFARAKPASAGYVEAEVPAKILNCYLHGHRGVTLAEFTQWRSKNADWAQRLKDGLRNAERFERTVKQMVAEMRSN